MSDSTAADAFWQAIALGLVPATVPVETIYGESGLATQSLAYVDNPKAEELVLSASWRERAVGAILACRHAALSINAENSEIRAKCDVSEETDN